MLQTNPDKPDKPISTFELLTKLNKVASNTEQTFTEIGERLFFNMLKDLRIDPLSTTAFAEDCTRRFFEITMALPEPKSEIQRYMQSLMKELCSRNPDMYVVNVYRTDLGSRAIRRNVDPDLRESEARSVAYDHGYYGVELDAEEHQLPAMYAKIMIEENQFGLSKSMARHKTVFIRKWLQLRLNAFRRNRVFSDQVTPFALERMYELCMGGLCPITLRPLTMSTLQDTDWSIDRAVNDDGYDIENLVMMSTKANLAKGNLSGFAILERACGLVQDDDLTVDEWGRLFCVIATYQHSLDPLLTGLEVVNLTNNCSVVGTMLTSVSTLLNRLLHPKFYEIEYCNEKIQDEVEKTEFNQMTGEYCVSTRCSSPKDGARFLKKAMRHHNIKSRLLWETVIDRVLSINRNNPDRFDAFLDPTVFRLTRNNPDNLYEMTEFLAFTCGQTVQRQNLADRLAVGGFINNGYQ